MAESRVPKSGDLLERTLSTSQGDVELLAEIVVEGDTLIMKDLVIYGRDHAKLTGLTKEVLAARTQLLRDVRSWGFLKLKVMGQRVPSSSSANPGHTIDITINLANF